METQVKEKTNPTKHLPPWNVIIHNSDDHTYEYVMIMLHDIFGYEKEKCFKLADQVDKDGKAVVFTTHKELAELKKEQIEAYGPDKLMKNCKGSLYATIEKAE